MQDRISFLQKKWTHIRAQLPTARDWRVEAQLRFELIDIQHEISRLTSLQHQRSYDNRQIT